MKPGAYQAVACPRGERVWDQHTRSVEDLAAGGAADVLAHPDLAKLAG